MTAEEPREPLASTVSEYTVEYPEPHPGDYGNSGYRDEVRRRHSDEIAIKPLLGISRWRSECPEICERKVRNRDAENYEHELWQRR